MTTHEVEEQGDGRPWALKRTIGSYSGGTRVEVLDFGGGIRVSVRVLATDEVIEVREDDLVKLRSGSI